MTGISLAVDARDLSSDLFPNGDIGPFLEHWTDLEERLRGQRLEPGTSFSVRLPGGELRMDVVSLLAPVVVDERTEFGIVAVRERSSVRSTYQCGTCRRASQRTYGPFICTQCPKSDQRVCDQHAVVLSGALTARCPQHAPACDCGTPAVIWCPGPLCHGRHAWCRMHSAAHASEPATAYCLPCLAELFPPCGVGRCDAIGSIACDHLSADGRPCDARRCPRHAKRWQVFGPHAEGLGRCEVHASLRGQPANELIYQVLGACAVRDQRPPTLASLRHMLMKLTDRNRTMREVYSLATAAPAATPPGLQRPVSNLVSKQKQRWHDDAVRSEESVDQRTAELRAWLNQHHNYQAAAALEGKTWVRPRADRPGMLFVAIDARLLNRQWRDAASTALGFDVRLETRA
jgi:hypothetical protein